MAYTYKPYEYTVDTYYGDNFFRFDPTMPVPVPDDHEDSGKTLAQIYGMTDEEAAEIVLNEKWNQVRKYRNAALKATDWVSGEDVPQTIKDLYFPYRQALREITDQGDPDNLAWPTAPEGN